MSGGTIGRGSGNEVPFQKIESFKASEAISRGQVVAFNATADDGFSISLADTSGGGVLALGIGVAKRDIPNGEWGPIIIGGFCDYLICDGTVTAGAFLVAKSGTPGTADTLALNTNDIQKFGIAYNDDDAVTKILDAAFIFNKLG